MKKLLSIYFAIIITYLLFSTVMSWVIGGIWSDILFFFNSQTFKEGSLSDLPVNVNILFPRTVGFK